MYSYTEASGVKVGVIVSFQKSLKAKLSSVDTGLADETAYQ
jgi:hypothetical protein